MLGAVEAEGSVAENAYVGVVETEGGASENALDTSASAAHLMKRAREDDLDGLEYHSSFEGESFGGDSPLV